MTGNFTAKVVHYLSRHPEKQEKLHQELKRILPDKHQPITAKDLEDMKYLRACLKETSRLAPIVPGNFREAPRDIILANFLIPKGTEILMGHNILSRLDEHFPEPDKFIPERWLKNSDQQQNAHPFVVLPFGFGPRMCLGRRFAELEAETLIANIYRNFRVEHDEDLIEVVTGLASIGNQLNFKLEERPT